MSMNATSIEAQREQMHRQMLSSVSHDLKTPLASVIGSLEIYLRMQQQLSPEKLQTLLETALHEAYRLDHFVTNILDMAKLENGMVQPRLETCHLRQLLQDCIERTRPGLHGAHIQLYSSAGNIDLHTDCTLLGRAVNLLLDNALKHGASGNAGRIELGFERLNDRIAITVRDHGPGIPADQSHAIFDKYTRLSRQDHQKAGTGLGLAICRTIASLLHGTVNVENMADAGARFTISLPAGN